MKPLTSKKLHRVESLLAISTGIRYNLEDSLKQLNQLSKLIIETLKEIHEDEK